MSNFSMPVNVFSLKKTALSHGWVRLPPFAWDDAAEVLSFPARVGGRPRSLRISQQGSSSLLIEANVDASLGSEVRSLVERVLMLGWEPASIAQKIGRLDPIVADYLRSGGGRLLRGATWFEDFAKTVCTINTSWGNTISMVQRLVTEFGDGAFPSATSVATLTEEELQGKAQVGYRAATLIEGARFAMERGLDDPSADAASVASSGLRAIRGIGPYAQDHLMVLLGDFSRIPVDSGVLAYCREHLGCSPSAKPEEVNALFEDWGDHKFIGYQFGRIVKRLNWTGD